MDKHVNELMEIFEKAKKYDKLLKIDEEVILRCSFCGMSQEDVKKLIASPKAMICNDCVTLCNEILEEELKDQL